LNAYRNNIENVNQKVNEILNI